LSRNDRRIYTIRYRWPAVYGGRADDLGFDYHQESEFMNQNDIKSIQRKIGVEPDGFWGPKSIAACQSHLRKLMPKNNPWPKSDQASLTKFYGAPGDESKLVVTDVSGLGIKYDSKPVRVIRCHQKVALSLKRIFTALSKGPHRSILEKYAGCFNNRPMRGGSLPSLHARGAAIDLDPDDNGNLVHWPMRATMPLEVMEEFAKEGWLPAGAFWSRDAMHMQATQ